MPPDGRTLQHRFVYATDALGDGRSVGISLVLPDVVTWVEQVEPSASGERGGVIINQLRTLDDGAALVIRLPLEADLVDQVFKAAYEVVLNGEPMFDDFTVGEVGNAFADA